jgi:16S rRNA (guanine966-N2)-methyltransferase
MRITGGELRGRTIYSGKFRDIRPATDRVRETIFAIIPQYIDLHETKVIDLYAGTGSLGFECISRGCQYVVFVDESRVAVDVMKRTAKTLDCENRCKIIHSRVEHFIDRMVEPAGLLFADPPYRMQDISSLPELIARSSISEKDAVLLIEHSKQTDFPESRLYTLFRQKIFGNTIVSFFRLS